MHWETKKFSISRYCDIRFLKKLLFKYSCLPFPPTSPPASFLMINLLFQVFNITLIQNCFVFDFTPPSAFTSIFLCLASGPTSSRGNVKDYPFSLGSQTLRLALFQACKLKNEQRHYFPSYPLLSLHPRPFWGVMQQLER